MRQVLHGVTPPPQLAAAHAAEPNPVDPAASWQAFGPGKQELRDDLWPRHHGRCAYCERCVPQVGTPIEHIRSKARHRFPEATFFYPNLVLNCDTFGTCTDHKRDDWSDDFIPPTDSRCDQWFCCELDGLIKPADGLGPAERGAVQMTIQMVNLNHPHLKRERKNLLLKIELACADMIDQRDALSSFLRAELDESDPSKPFLSCKRRYFGSPN